ncbi:MAG: hypothetical protein HOY78_02035 [Saccharothrix sp.]|nr:hypothetical protein [Saccharothrix sp.]
MDDSTNDSSSSSDSSTDDDYDDFEDDYDDEVDDYDDTVDDHHHHAHSSHRSSMRSGRGLRGLDLVGAPSWVKVFVWVGVLTAVAGMGVFFLELVTAMGSFGDQVDSPGPFGTPDPYSSRRTGPDPSKIGLAFGLFFVGFVFFIIGNLGNASSRRR